MAKKKQKKKPAKKKIEYKEYEGEIKYYAKGKDKSKLASILKKRLG